MLLILTKFNKYWQWNFSVLLGVVLVVIVGVCLILSGALIKSKFYLQKLFYIIYNMYLYYACVSYINILRM